MKFFGFLFVVSLLTSSFYTLPMDPGEKSQTLTVVRVKRTKRTRFVCHSRTVQISEANQRQHLDEPPLLPSLYLQPLQLNLHEYETVLEEIQGFEKNIEALPALTLHNTYPYTRAVAGALQRFSEPSFVQKFCRLPIFCQKISLDTIRHTLSKNDVTKTFLSDSIVQALEQLHPLQ